MRPALPSRFALSPNDNQQAEQSQERLISSLNAENRARFFPAFSNPKASRLLGIRHHIMGRYPLFSFTRARLSQAKCIKTSLVMDFNTPITSRDALGKRPIMFRRQLLETAKNER